MRSKENFATKVKGRGYHRNLKREEWSPMESRSSDDKDDEKEKAYCHGELKLEDGRIQKSPETGNEAKPVVTNHLLG